MGFLNKLTNQHKELQTRQTDQGPPQRGMQPQHITLSGLQPGGPGVIQLNSPKYATGYSNNMMGQASAQQYMYAAQMAHEQHMPTSTKSRDGHKYATVTKESSK